MESGSWRLHEACEAVERNPGFSPPRHRRRRKESPHAPNGGLGPHAHVQRSAPIKRFGSRNLQVGGKAAAAVDDDTALSAVTLPPTLMLIGTPDDVIDEARSV